MSKVILILDEMPKRCILCNLSTITLDSNLDKYIKCTALERKICDSWLDVSRDNNIRPDWCPLHDLPEKMLTWHDDEQDDYEMGWNACLDAITGEEEE